MKTSGLFNLHAYRIRVKDNQPIRLVFFGDVHRDSPNHADAAWQQFLGYARGLENAWFVGMGDYLDSTSTSERECLAGSASRLHETTKWDLEQLTNAKVGLLAKELEFMRGRLVGLINGNHYFEFQSGINSDQKLAEKLQCRYLGVSAFVRLQLSASESYAATQTFDLWLHHGAGGARLPGGSINRVDQMREFADADAFAMGHDHKRGVMPATPRLRLSNNRGEMKLEERQQWLLRTGSFLKSYEPGRVSYNVDAARGPCSLGWVELEITYRRQRRGQRQLRWLDVRGIS